MTSTAKPNFLAVDHISWTVPDIDAALAFYVGVIGAVELWRMGPMDAAEMPVGADGRDWMETHVGVAGACLTLVHVADRRFDELPAGLL